jgi:hypothetical protein
VQPISGELNHNTPHEISVVPPTPEPPHIEHRADDTPPATNATPPLPPPPPKPKFVEYKSEDPWANIPHDSEEAHPEKVNSPDRI